MASLHRREVLALGAAVYVGIVPETRGVAAPTVDLRRFQAASEKLCGVVLDDPSFARAIVGVLADDPAADGLPALLDLVEVTPLAGLDAAIAAHGHDELADHVVQLWYSGVAGQSGAERVLSYTTVAAWTATGYAKPPTYCGPEFGAWARPPATSSGQ